MASLSHSQSSALRTPSHSNRSVTTVDHSPLSSPNSACFPGAMLPQFDGHLPLSKVQQQPTQASWQPPSVSHLNKHLNNSLGFADSRLLSVFSVDGLSDSQTFKDCPAQLAENSSLSPGIWEGDVGQKLVYMLPAASDHLALPSTMNLGGHCLSEGASVGESVGMLASNAAGKGAVSSLLAASSPTLSEIEKFFNVGGSNFASVDVAVNLGLTVDPSKGGLAIQGSNLPVSSHCLANFSSDPGFAERAAKFSCFGNQDYSALAQSYSVADHGGKTLNRSAYRTSDKLTPTKLSRVPSGHLTPRCSAPNSPVRATGSGGSPSGLSENFSLKEPVVVKEEPKCMEKRLGKNSCSPSQIDCIEGSQKLCTSMNESDEADGSLGQEVSSSCERGGCEIPSQGLTQSRGKKRKLGFKDRPKDASGIAKELETDEGKGKRPKSDDSTKEDEQKPKVEQSTSGNSGESTPKSVKESSKPPEAPKPDYIHVRARRGQATDSHSLAERVRREKISERMKFLQDLVPGCSKVTGKAVMLDEIINYVQSLQRQVEFLSMKLAAVNPRLEFNLDSLFSKEIMQPRVASQTMLFAAENTNSFPSLHQQPQGGSLQVGSSCPVDVHSLGLDSGLRRTISTPARASLDAFGESISQQISQAWDDELQSVVQMGFAQGLQTPLSSPSLQGRLFPGQMKAEP